MSNNKPPDKSNNIYFDVNHRKAVQGPGGTSDSYKAMRSVVRDRQNCYADWLDEMGWADLGLQVGTQLVYDWYGDLKYRWMPSNGVYHPEMYIRREWDGYYSRFGKPGSD